MAKRGAKIIKNAQTITNEDGSVTTRLKDGTLETRLKDGTLETETVDAEGTRTQRHHDGTSTIIYKDGTEQEFDKNGGFRSQLDNDGNLWVVNADGSTTTNRPDMTVITSKDGIDRTVLPNGDTITSYPDERVVKTFAKDDSHLVIFPDHSSVLTSATGWTIAEDSDHTTRFTDPDGTVWTEFPDGTKSIRQTDGTVTNKTPGFEVTTDPDGTKRMSFPGGVELERLPGGTNTWSSSAPSAMLDADGFDSDGVATADVTSSGDGLDPATDVIGDIDEPLAGAAILGASEDAAATEPGSTATNNTWDDPVLGSTVETVAQASGSDLTRPGPDADLNIGASDAVTDDSMVEQPSPQDQFTAETAAVADAGGGMLEDFDTSTITAPADMTDDELT